MTTSHKYARIESERRFLLRKLPDDLDQEDYKLITDRYWPETRMRLRRIDLPEGAVLQRKLTQKYTELDRSLEETVITNQYLTTEEYDLFSQLPGLEMVKRRYRYLHAGSGYSLDQFEGPLAGLLLAEIEAGQGVLPPGEVPEFVVCEVTNVLAFTGGALVQTGAEELSRLLVKWLGAG